MVKETYVSMNSIRKYIFPSLVIGIVALSSTYIHEYIGLQIDLLPFALESDLFPSHIDIPLAIYFPHSIPYFFISFLLFVITKGNKLYAILLPILAMIADSLHLYLCSSYEATLIFGKNGFLIAHFVRLVFALGFSYSGAILALYIRSLHSEAGACERV